MFNMSYEAKFAQMYFSQKSFTISNADTQLYDSWRIYQLPDDSPKQTNNNWENRQKYLRKCKEADWRRWLTL